MASVTRPLRFPEASDAERRPSQRAANPFLPMLLLALAFLAWCGFQTWQLVSERQQLTQLWVAQEPTIANAGKLRASLDAVASATAKLATEGNGSAALIVEELRRRGITINIESAAPAK